MNGSFKTEFYRAKEDLMSFKIQRGMPAKLNATDIIPLLNIAWNKSFAKIENNQKAISTRGWYPPTRKVLQDPRVRDLQDQDTGVGITPADPIQGMIENVNVESGEAARVMDALLSHAARKDGTRRRLESLADGEARIENLRKAKKITSGVLIKNGIHSCNDPDVVQIIQEKIRKKQLEQQEKEKKARDRIAALTEQVANTREKKGTDPEYWTATECRSFLQYKKQNGDPMQ